MALPASGLIRHWHINSGLYKDAGSTSATTIGDSIQEWHDIVSGDVASQTLSGKQPILEGDGLYFNKTKILEGNGINLGSSAKTLVVLIKTDGYGVVADINSSTTSGASFNINVSNSGTFRSYTNGANSNRHFIEEWTHSEDLTNYSIAALTYPANPTGIGNAYINGNLLAVDDPGRTPDNIDGLGTLSIGGSSVLSSALFWDGYIKAVALWDVELTATEIASLTQEDLVPPVSVVPKNVYKMWKSTEQVYSDAGTTLAVSGDNVQEWHDLTSGEVLSQTNVADQPFISEDYLGQPSVDFDSFNWLQSLNNIILPENSPLTIVFTLTSDVESNAWLMSWPDKDSPSDTLTFGQITNYGTTNKGMRVYNTIGFWSWRSYLEQLEQGQANTIVYILESTANLNSATMYTNGIAQAHDGDRSLDNIIQGKLTLGWITAVRASFTKWRGSISSVVIYERALSPQEAASIGTDFNQLSDWRIESGKIPNETILDSKLQEEFVFYYFLKGSNLPATVSIVNGEFSINEGLFGTSPQTINAEDKLTIKHVSANDYNTTKQTTVTIGADSFTITSETQGTFLERSLSWFRSNWGTYTDLQGSSPTNQAISGDIVGTWQDEKGFKLPQASTNSTAPLLEANMVLGAPALKFSGSSENLYDSGYNLGDSARTVIALVRLENVTDSWINKGFATLNDRYSTGRNYTVTAEVGMRAYSDVRLWENNPVSDTAFQVLIVSNETPATSQNTRAWLDGVELTDVTGANSGTLNTDGTNYFEIGSPQSFSFKGWLAAFVVSEEAIQDSDIPSITAEALLKINPPSSDIDINTVELQEEVLSQRVNTLRNLSATLYNYSLLSQRVKVVRDISSITLNQSTLTERVNGIREINAPALTTSSKTEVAGVARSINAAEIVTSSGADIISVIKNINAAENDASSEAEVVKTRREGSTSLSTQATGGDAVNVFPDLSSNQLETTPTSSKLPIPLFVNTINPNVETQSTKINIAKNVPTVFLSHIVNSAPPVVDKYYEGVILFTASSAQVLKVIRNVPTVNLTTEFSALGMPSIARNVGAATLSYAQNLEIVDVVKDYNGTTLTQSSTGLDIPTIARAYEATTLSHSNDLDIPSIVKDYELATPNHTHNGLDVVHYMRPYNATELVATANSELVRARKQIDVVEPTFNLSVGRIITLSIANWYWVEDGASSLIYYINSTTTPQLNFQAETTPTSLLMEVDVSASAFYWYPENLTTTVLFVTPTATPQFDFIGSRAFSSAQRITNLNSTSYSLIANYLQVNPEAPALLSEESINWRSSYAIANSLYTLPVSLNSTQFDFYVDEDLIILVSEIDTPVLLSEEKYDIFTLEEVVVKGYAHPTELSQSESNPEGPSSPLEDSIIESNGLMPNDDYTVTDDQIFSGVPYKPIFDFVSDLPGMQTVANSCTPDDEPAKWELQSFSVDFSITSPIYTGTMTFKRTKVDEEPFSMPDYDEDSIIRMDLAAAHIDANNYYNGARGNGISYRFHVSNMSLGDDGTLQMNLDSVSRDGANAKIPKNKRIAWSRGRPKIEYSKSTQSRTKEVYKRKKTDKKKLTGGYNNWNIAPVYEKVKEKTNTQYTVLSKKVTYPDAGYYKTTTHRFFRAVKAYNYLEILGEYQSRLWRKMQYEDQETGEIKEKWVWVDRGQPFPSVDKKGAIIEKGQTYLEFTNSLAQEAGYVPVYLPDFRFYSKKIYMKYIAADRNPYNNLNYSSIEFSKKEEDDVLKSSMDNIFSESLNVDFSNIRKGIVFSFGEKPEPKERKVASAYQNFEALASYWTSKKYDITKDDPPVREREVSATYPAVPHVDPKYNYRFGDQERAQFVSHNKNQSSYSTYRAAKNLLSRVQKPDWSYEVEMKFRPDIRLTKNPYHQKEEVGQIRAPITNYSHSIDFGDKPKARTKISVGQEVI